MEIIYGASVIDKDGNLLGTVDHLVNNLSTGELTKFLVYRKGNDKDLFISPEDVQLADEQKVTLNVGLEELTLR